MVGHIATFLNAAIGPKKKKKTQLKTITNAAKKNTTMGCDLWFVVVWIGLLLGFVDWFVASGGSGGGCSVIGVVLNAKIKPKIIIFYCVFYILCYCIKS